MAREGKMIVSEVEKHLAEGVTLCIPSGVTLLNFFCWYILQVTWAGLEPTSPLPAHKVPKVTKVT